MDWQIAVAISALSFTLFVLIVFNINFFRRIRFLQRFHRYLGFTDKEVTTKQKEKNTVNQISHVLGGMIVGYIFGIWIAALVVGLIKEIVEAAIFRHQGRLNREKIRDGITDLGFWILGGLSYPLLEQAQAFFSQL